MKNKINIIRNLLLLITFTMLLTSCSLLDSNEINVDEIFMQEESEYFIYFYKDDCTYCDNVKGDIEEFSVNNTVYKINLSKKKNTLIARSYTDGEGSNGKYHVSGVTKYDELYISIVPAIIKINDCKSSYIAGGTNEIYHYLYNEE